MAAEFVKLITSELRITCENEGTIPFALDAMSRLFDTRIVAYMRAYAYAQSIDVFKA